MQTIAERLKNALQAINGQTQAANRAPNSVQLLAVSKSKPVSDIVLAYEQGQRLFGENYVQEGVQKVQALQHLPDIEWHFIGPLQSNKTRPVAEHFAWLHSLERIKIAERINSQRSPHAAPMQVCIQVNIDQQASKAGVAPNEVIPLAQQISQLPRLTLRGLMCIPAPGNQAAFADMQTLFGELQQACPQVDTLSMGMSDDMPSAIAHGSTLVRLGTAIFGSRPPATKQ